MKKSDILVLAKLCDILQKGSTLPVGSVRVWGGKEYVKVAPGKWRLKKVLKKEPWDSSSEKAKELKISDFGTFEEVQEMVKMPRTAKSREEAVSILKQVAKNGNLRSKSGVVASLSGKSIDEIVSGQALHQSFNTMAHWQAAANLDKLFSNAIEPWKFMLSPHKNNENLKDRRYLYAPMEYCGCILPVKLTVKEYAQIGIGNHIYSIEAIDVGL